MRILTIILYTYIQQNKNTHVIGLFHASKKHKRTLILRQTFDQENSVYLIGYKLNIIIFFICGKIIPDGFLMSMQFYTIQKGGLVLEYHNASRWVIDYSSNKLLFDQFLCDTW